MKAHPRVKSVTFSLRCVFNLFIYVFNLSCNVMILHHLLEMGTNTQKNSFYEGLQNVFLHNNKC